MNNTSSTQKVRMITFNALFIALMLVMKLTGIGLIRLGVINITFYCTIITICTLLLDLKSGLIQGAAFATISLIDALQAPTTLVAPIVTQSVFTTVLLCYVPRLLVPVVTYFSHKLLCKNPKSDEVALAAAGALGSVTNSVLYLGIMVLCYLPMLADYPAVLGTTGGIVLYGSIPEAVAAGFLTPALVVALRQVKR